MTKETFLSKLNTALPWLSESASSDLYDFMRQVLEKNKVLNLTAITDEDEFLKKHFVDSLSLLDIDICLLNSRSDETKIIDVGTGAGFPGIPLAIALRGKCFKFTLCDSLQKRLKFLEEVVEALNLTNVELVHARAEDLASDGKYREAYDLALSRAVAELPVLCEICLPFVKCGGDFISYKMADCDGEIASAENAIRTLGGDFENLRVSSYNIGSSDSDKERALIKINKKSATPAKYPRKPGDIKKKPL